MINVFTTFKKGIEVVFSEDFNGVLNDSSFEVLVALVDVTDKIRAIRKSSRYTSKLKCSVPKMCSEIVWVNPVMKF